MELTQLYKPKQEPMRLAIFMSGSGTNAQKIIEEYLRQRDQGTPSFEPVIIITDNRDSNAIHIGRSQYKNKELFLPIFTNVIHDFYRRANCDKLGDIDVRAKFDAVQSEVLHDREIDAVALAGYNWKVTSVIYDGFLTINVHPGNLRLKLSNGAPILSGLGWEPSAKAIYIGQNRVNSSVHLVEEGVDKGGILAVSAPRRIADKVQKMSLDERAELFGEALSLVSVTSTPGDSQSAQQLTRAISRFIRKNPDMPDEELCVKFPIYNYAKACQERLKVHGDWIIYPKTIDAIARGEFAKDENGQIYYKGVHKPTGIKFDLEGSVAG